MASFLLYAFSVIPAIAIIAIIIYVQTKLSKSESKFLGLILPGITFLFSLVMVFSFYIFYSGASTETSSIIDEETNEAIEETVEVNEKEMESSDMATMGYSFLLTNIPTFILTGIYINQRTKINRAKQVDKIKIKDL